jgi:hypothetical protein
MAKSLDKIKASLKLRTESRDRALTLRLGVRKYVLPFETRLIQSDEYIFVHVPPSAEILKFEDNELTLVENVEEAEKAVKSFRKARRRSGAAAGSPDLPDELQEALRKVPEGFKLGYDEQGNPKLIKKRRRKRSRND